MDTQKMLKKYFGYDSFRGGQEALVNAILSGHDALGIMPTGAGKSICFQLPALMHSGITLVISPLISLMQDQVGALIQSGVAAAYINSSLTPRQVNAALANAKNGKYKLIYVAPERLLSPEFIDFAQSVQISMLTVDEAHCISQWGQDFRPSYAQIPQFINMLSTRPLVSAFTATATLQVRDDILKLLCLQSPEVLIAGFDRKNLYFEIDAPKNKALALASFLSSRKDKSGIIYCTTRKTVEDVCEMLNLKGFSALRYHAGLPDGERMRNQDDFLYDRAQIMVATNAFGMGIDKSNVSFVVHYNMPKDIESYYQEAGRAGRDGSDASCLLLYSGQDVITNKWMINNSKDSSSHGEQADLFLKERETSRLREMTFLATTNDCIRGNILKYFGETPPTNCGHCGNCNTKFEDVDITSEAQNIIDCVTQMHERFGATLVAEVLCKGKSDRVFKLGLDKLPCYGKSDKSTRILRKIIDFLIQNHYLEKSDGEYPVLQLGLKVIDYSNAQIIMKLAKDREPTEKNTTHSSVSSQAELAAKSSKLYQSLRELRQKTAQEQGVPSFVVFTDKTLVDMCVKQPKTPAAFLQVSGVGDAKMQRYGDKFLKIINEFCSNSYIE